MNTRIVCYYKFAIAIISYYFSLVNQLHYNELYDLYRDDYKLLKNEDVKHINQNSKVIKLLPCYQNMVSQKKYVSYHAWHPTIPGKIILILLHMGTNN